LIKGCQREREEEGEGKKGLPLVKTNSEEGLVKRKKREINSSKSNFKWKFLQLVNVLDY
jgi:hypothetical protein